MHASAITNAHIIQVRTLEKNLSGAQLNTNSVKQISPSYFENAFCK